MVLDGEKQVALHSCHKPQFFSKKSRPRRTKINLFFSEKLAAE